MSPSAPASEREELVLPRVRHDWTEAEVRAIHDRPFPDLLFEAQTVHRVAHDPRKIQLCQLLSIKTGTCPEDCAYCPQSAHHSTGLTPARLVAVDAVREAARGARASGATRLCMGAAWREPRDGREFDEVLEMVRAVRTEGLEACCTLGMLTEDQAGRLAEAGLTAYNHNLDTGPEFYDKIVTTRTYADRIATLKRVQRAGIDVCSGGIIGMGESISDRAAMIVALASLEPHPQSIPINALVRVPGTPLAERPVVDPLEFVRMIATARIVFPRSRVRLSAGRAELSREAQALAFLAGANSIFLGEKLLTTPNPEEASDLALLADLGLEPMSDD